MWLIFASAKKFASISKVKWKIFNSFGPAKPAAIKEQEEQAESAMEQSYVF